MSAPHLQHLAQLIANEGHATTFQSLGQYRQALLKEITQASAAPEQVAVAWLLSVEGYKDVLVDNYQRALSEQEHFLGRGRTCVIRNLYTHADPSEVERLRAELELWKLRSGGNLYAAQVMEELADGQETELVALEKKLTEAQALLRAYDQPIRVAIKMLERTLSPTAMEIDLELKRCLGDSCDLLSATAQPAESVTCVTCNDVGVIGHSIMCPECTPSNAFEVKS